MADNIVLNTGSGGDTLAADDVSGVKYQVAKLAHGGDGSATLVALASGLPVQPATSATWAATQSGSWTVAATQSGTWSVTDGAGSLTVDDGGLTLSIDDGSGSLTVDGTVAATQSGSWSVTVSGSVTVTDGSGSLTVDGTVAATQSGTWSCRITDGTDTADVLDLTNTNPLAVAIVDGSGTQITSFGGGSQYAVDAAAGTDTGTLALVVRDDSLATLTPADGDYTSLRVSSRGAVWSVHDVAKSAAASIAAATSNSAGGTTTGSAVDNTSGREAGVIAYILNGGTGPTAPAYVSVQVSSDGTNWYEFTRLTAGVTSSTQYDFAIDLPRWVQRIRVVVSGNTAQAVTCGAFVWTVDRD